MTEAWIECFPLGTWAVSNASVVSLSGGQGFNAVKGRWQRLSFGSAARVRRGCPSTRTLTFSIPPPRSLAANEI
ncbi:MAG TPA: hypothetical protein VEX67_00695, partial [Solirubrobacteraceae bacterium]|nr:hypothetical protein [Solirubrobacteraceae bacterium]